MINERLTKENKVVNEKDIKKVEKIEIKDFYGKAGETKQVNFAGYIFTVYYYEEKSTFGTVGHMDVKKVGVQRKIYSLKSYSFKEISQVVRYFDTEVSRIQAVLDRRNAKKKARAEQKKKGNPFKVGDLLYNSWGWEQTNIDYYQVVEVSKSSVYIKEIYKNYEATHSMAGISTAKKDSFKNDEVIRKTVQYPSWENGVPYLSSEFGTLSLTSETKTHYESSYA